MTVCKASVDAKRRRNKVSDVFLSHVFRWSESTDLILCNVSYRYQKQDVDQDVLCCDRLVWPEDVFSWEAKSAGLWETKVQLLVFWKENSSEFQDKKEYFFVSDRKKLTGLMFWETSEKTQREFQAFWLVNALFFSIFHAHFLYDFRSFKFYFGKATNKAMIRRIKTWFLDQMQMILLRMQLYLIQRGEDMHYVLIFCIASMECIKTATVCSHAGLLNEHLTDVHLSHSFVSISTRLQKTPSNGIELSESNLQSHRIEYKRDSIQGHMACI